MDPNIPKASNTPSSTTSQIWHTTTICTTNPQAPTLLLLHGLFSSHLEFTPLLPLLTPHYTLLLVDLPAHSRSRSPQLNAYRLPQTVAALATLIKETTPTGTAHVAGLSFGAFIGLELARLHPDVVDSLFASGAPPFEGKERWFASRPSLLWYVEAAPVYMPDVLFRWMCRNVFGVSGDIAELRRESKQNFTSELLRSGFADCLSVTLEEVGGIRGVRTVAVAGGRQDNVDVTRRMGVVLREGDSGNGCRAYVVRRAIHAWDLQFPELFAEGIRAWIEEREMPSEFEELV